MTATAAARGAVRPVLAAALLADGATVELPLGGASMRPLLEPGDLLLVAPAAPAALRPGDVALVDVGGLLLAHRLWYRDAARLITRGDASDAFDPPHPPAALLGRVIGYRRHGRSHAIDAPPAPLYALRALLRC